MCFGLMSEREGENNFEMTCKERFLQQILNLENKKQTHYSVLKLEAYNHLLKEVEEAKTAVKKTPSQYRRLKRFNVLKTRGTKRLVSANEPEKHFVAAEEIFDIIESAHTSVGHGGRDKLKVETSRKYMNITTEMINMFLAMCETCQRKKSNKRKGSPPKTIPHADMNSRCQIDFIDMQAQSDRGLNFIMVYQDNLTKFVLLRALHTKTAEEVANQLIDIFVIFGAPCILHSDNGKEFVNSIIKEVTVLWPELKLVIGTSSSNSQSWGSVKRATQDVKNMLASWMHDNNSKSWSRGLPFVQFMKNRAFHSGIKQSPYKAMFGIEPRVGLASSALPSEVIQNIENEEDLQKIVEEMSRIEANFEEGEEVRGDAASTGNHSASGKQAKKIKLISDATLPPVEVGDDVLIPIPDVDLNWTVAPVDSSP